jgi:hypothetical protein
MPFAVVAIVLLWQWSIHLALPFLEKWLVYADEDDEQISKLHDLSERVLTRGDLLQLIAATLETICDYLRTAVAFVASFKNDDLSLIQQVGELDFADDTFYGETEDLRTLAAKADHVAGRSAFQKWENFQIVPLYSRRITNNGDVTPSIIGVMGIQVAKDPTQIVDAEDVTLLYTLVQRVEQTLDDIVLQDEIFAVLEGLLPQFTMTRVRADEVEYRPGYTRPKPPDNLPAEEETYELVRAALRHYWGGAGIARSRLLEFKVVRKELETAESSTQALRNVLQTAIERLRPAGERSLTGTEWTLYNILDLRFIEGRKVRDVARRMSLSEPDLYRKQRLAIETIADSILEMERNLLNL